VFVGPAATVDLVRTAFELRDTEQFSLTSSRGPPAGSPNLQDRTTCISFQSVVYRSWPAVLACRPDEHVRALAGQRGAADRDAAGHTLAHAPHGADFGVGVRPIEFGLGQDPKKELGQLRPVSGSENGYVAGRSRPKPDSQVDPKQTEGEPSLFLFHIYEAVVRVLTHPGRRRSLAPSGVQPNSR
jgi:hypothetical protein